MNRWLIVYQKGIRVLGLLSLAFGLAYIGHYAFNSQKAPSPKQKSALTDDQPLNLSNPVLTEFENDTLKLRLVANSAQLFERNKRMSLSKITATLFETNSSIPTASVWSDYGEFKGKSDLIRLWGKVRIETNSGQHLLTEELFIDRSKEVIFNEVTVTAFSKNDIIKATAMHYSISNKVLLLTKPVAKIEF